MVSYIYSYSWIVREVVLSLLLNLTYLKIKCTTHQPVVNHLKWSHWFWMESISRYTSVGIAHIHSFVLSSSASLPCWRGAARDLREALQAGIYHRVPLRHHQLSHRVQAGHLEARQQGHRSRFAQRGHQVGFRESVCLWIHDLRQSTQPLSSAALNRSLENVKHRWLFP